MGEGRRGGGLFMGGREGFNFEPRIHHYLPKSGRILGGLHRGSKEWRIVAGLELRGKSRHLTTHSLT